MPDEPVIIKGGSLIITIKGKGGDVIHTHPATNGKLTSVDIDGMSYPLTENSEIIIHYEVPELCRYPEEP